MRRMCWPILLLIGAFGCRQAAQSTASLPGQPVALQVVKLDGYQKTLAAQKGKIVVQDIWGEF